MSSYKSETADIHSADTSVLPRLVRSMADSLTFRICISVVSRYTYMTIVRRFRFDRALAFLYRSETL